MTLRRNIYPGLREEGAQRCQPHPVKIRAHLLTSRRDEAGKPHWGPPLGRISCGPKGGHSLGEWLSRGRGNPPARDTGGNLCVPSFGALRILTPCQFGKLDTGDFSEASSNALMFPGCLRDVFKLWQTVRHEEKVNLTPKLPMDRSAYA